MMTISARIVFFLLGFMSCFALLTIIAIVSYMKEESKRYKYLDKLVDSLVDNIQVELENEERQESKENKVEENDTDI